MNKYFVIGLGGCLLQASTVNAVDVNNWDDWLSAVRAPSVSEVNVISDIAANSSVSVGVYRDLLISGTGTTRAEISGEGNWIHLKAQGADVDLTLKNLAFSNFLHSTDDRNFSAVFDATKYGNLIIDNVSADSFNTPDGYTYQIYGGVLNVNDNSSASVSNSVFSNNKQVVSHADNDAAVGGVIHVQGKITSYDQSTLTKAVNTIFRNNSISASASGAFGGVAYIEGSAGILSDDLFDGNMAQTTGSQNAYGGAIAVGGANAHGVRGNAVVDTLKDSEFVGNKALASGSGESYGGALYVSKGGIVNNISGLTFNGNSADHGGAIYNEGKIGRLVDSDFVSATDTLENASTGVIEVLGGAGGTTIAGAFINAGKAVLSDKLRVDGGLANSGTLVLSGAAYTGNVENSGIIEIDAGGNNSISGSLQNSGTADWSGGINLAVGGGLINTGVLKIDAVNYRGNIDNQNSFTVSGINSVDGNITNSGRADFNSGAEVDVSGITTNRGTMNFNGVQFGGNINNAHILSVHDSNAVDGQLTNNGVLLVLQNADFDVSQGVINNRTIYNLETLKLADGSQNNGSISGDVQVGNGTAATTFVNNGFIGGNAAIKANALMQSGLGTVGNIDIASGGVLEINQDGFLTQNISGAGEVRLQNALHFGGGSLSNNGILTVADSGKLYLADRNLNVGTLNLDGTLALSIGQIAAGSSNFTGGKITVADAASIGSDAKLELTITSGLLNKDEHTADIKLVDGNNVSGAFTDIAGNNRYDIRAGSTAGSVVIKATASGSQVVTTFGGNRNNRNTAAAWDAANVASGGAAATVKGLLNSYSQHNAYRYVNALSKVAPSDSRLVLTDNLQINRQIGLNVQNRYYQRSNAEILAPSLKRSLWVEALGNYGRYDTGFDAAGFNAHSQGYVFGFDSMLNPQTMLGVGYAFHKTDASSRWRDTDINGHNLFAYGKYQQEEDYVRGMLSYGRSSYKDKGALEGIAIDAKHNVDAFAAELAAGHEYDEGLVPEVGLRYAYLMPESYYDSLGQRVNPQDAHLLTAMARVYYRPQYFTPCARIRPVAYMGVAYDLYSENLKTDVRIADTQYRINTQRMSRLSAEGGLGVEAFINDWEFSLNYNLGLRQDYQSHTGMFSARYNF